MPGGSWAKVDLRYAAISDKVQKRANVKSTSNWEYYFEDDDWFVEQTIWDFPLLCCPVDVPEAQVAISIRYSDLF